MGGSMWAESGGAGEGSLFRWCIRVRVPDVKPGSVRGGGGNGSTPSGSARCSLECPPVGASAGSSARSSSEVYRGIGGGGITGLAAVGRAVSGALYDLAGRRVLLVEPCTMVRQVLALALRRFGCFVCAVSSEAEAAGRLKMAASTGLAGAAPSQPPLLFSGSSSRNGGPDSVAAQLAAQPLGGQAPGQPGPALRLRGGLRKQRRRHLELEHGGQWLEYEFQVWFAWSLCVCVLRHVMPEVTICFVWHGSTDAGPASCAAVAQSSSLHTAA
jgi:CheY-like chemotaxis protein